MQGRLFFDPVLMRGYHALNLAPGRSHWSAHEKTLVRDLETDGFSFAAYYTVFHADILTSEPEGRKILMKSKTYGFFARKVTKSHIIRSKAA